jgi:hypothetical protein
MNLTLAFLSNGAKSSVEGEPAAMSTAELRIWMLSGVPKWLAKAELHDTTVECFVKEVGVSGQMDSEIEIELHE